MKKLFFSLLIIPNISLAICPEGLWDFGKRVASAEFSCKNDDTAKLRFCKREYVLMTGKCNHIGSAIPCEKKDNIWICKDSHYYSETVWTSDTSIHFSFESSFNSGEFEGIRF